jgi:hypothetical protein
MHTAYTAGRNSKYELYSSSISLTSIFRFCWFMVEGVAHVCVYILSHIKQKQTPWTVVRKRTIPTELPPFVGEVIANFWGYRVLRGQRNESPRPLISVF